MMKGKIFLCSVLLLTLFGCPLMQRQKSVAIDDIYAIPGPSYTVDKIQERYETEILAFPAYWLAKDAHLHILFVKDGEIYLATFGVSEEKWEILEIRLISEEELGADKGKVAQ